MINENETFIANENMIDAANAKMLLPQMLKIIAEGGGHPCIHTGFAQMDAVLEGGLYEGLYTIGAISSIGKTTFVMQMMDQIAQSGIDVVVFSLEMARVELIAKSISRLTLADAVASGGDMKSAKTMRDIMAGSRFTSFDKDEQIAIEKAFTTYSQYAGNIYIHEGNGDVGVRQIRDIVDVHIKHTGKLPVVAIDYLQILAPHSERLSDKQNVDRAVSDLKRLSRDYKIPVLAISSFNRQNYKETAAMESFKESGACEYGSDVLIGLQLAGVGGKSFDLTAEKKKNPRVVELVILKNRSGIVGDVVTFDYYPAFNCFVESQSQKKR